jgi:hypothetical protein
MQVGATPALARADALTHTLAQDHTQGKRWWRVETAAVAPVRSRPMAPGENGTAARTAGKIEVGSEATAARGRGIEMAVGMLPETETGGDEGIERTTVSLPDMRYRAQKQRHLHECTDTSTNTNPTKR